MYKFKFLLKIKVNVVVIKNFIEWIIVVIIVEVIFFVGFGVIGVIWKKGMIVEFDVFIIVLGKRK